MAYLTRLFQAGVPLRRDTRDITQLQSIAILCMQKYRLKDAKDTKAFPVTLI